MNNEDKMTEWFARQSPLDPMSFPIGIGDDMAQVNVSGDASVLLTTDMLLDGVHFELEKCTAEQAGYKAMAASLSDCAAMATVPSCAIVSVALPRDFGEQRIKELYRGMKWAGDLFDCPIIGGDITSWHNPLAISVAMMSKPGNCRPAKRSGARGGDTICVTGTLGCSLRGKHLDFVPRVKEALFIAENFGVNAMMDITDGLVTDLCRLCGASGTGALLEAQQIPVSDAAIDSEDPLAHALNDGEDFELLFTMSASQCSRMMEAGADFKITRIGTITLPGARMEALSDHVGTPAEAGKVQMVTVDDKIIDLEPGGYDHL